MAEFCLDCWNKFNHTNDGEENYVISRYLDLCEGCGEYKHVIIVDKRENYYNHYCNNFLSEIACGTIYSFWRLFTFPFRVYKWYRSRKK